MTQPMFQQLRSSAEARRADGDHETAAARRSVTLILPERACVLPPSPPSLCRERNDAQNSISPLRIP